MNTTNTATATNETENLVEIEVAESVEVLAENEAEAEADVVKGARGRKAIEYTIHGNNQPYLAYLNTLAKATSQVYGYTIKGFLASLGQKTPKRITWAEIESYVGNSKQKKVAIKGLYLWAIENNVGNTMEDIQRVVWAKIGAM